MQDNDDILHVIKIISERIQRSADFDLSKIGLTLAQWRVIAFISSSQETVSQKDLEKYMGVSHPAIVGTLKRLAAKEILYSELDSTDKRIKRVFLTAYGKELCNKVSYFRQQMEDKLTKGFDKSETILLHQLLGRVKSNIG